MDVLPAGTLRAHRPPRVSAFVKGGLGLLVTANIDMLIAFSTPYWATWSNKETGEYGGYGLWKIWTCKPGTNGTDANCDEKMADLHWPAWYVTMQVLQTLGLAGFLAALIVLLLYVYLKQWEKNKTVMSSLIATGYLSGFFVMVGLFIFAYKVVGEIHITGGDTKWILSHSFSLACTAFVLNQIAASILVTEIKRLHRLHNEKLRNQNIHREELESFVRTQ